MLYKLLTVVLLFCFNSLYAQELVSKQLKRPVEKAITTNYELLNKSLEVQKTQLEVNSVKAKRLPSVAASALYTHFYQEGQLDIPTVTLPITGLDLFEGSRSFKLNGNIINAGVSASQIIFGGLQIQNGQKALEAKTKAQQLLADASKETIAKDVIGSFDQLMLLVEAEKLIGDTEKRLEKENLKVKKAITNGLAIPYDRDKITLALLELEAKKIELKGNRKLLYQKLAQLTHLDTLELKNIQYPLETILLDETGINAEKRLELEALQYSGKAFDYVLKKEKGAALPGVFAFANVSYTNLFNSKLTLKDVGPFNDVNLNMNRLSMFPNAFVGVGAKWNIFSGGEHKNKISSAKTDIQINNNKLKETEEKLDLLIQKSKTDYQNANEKLKISLQRMAIAKNSMNMASKQYQEGLINVTERLESENDLFKSSLTYYMQLVEQRNASLDLLQASGDLLNKILN